MKIPWNIEVAGKRHFSWIGDNRSISPYSSDIEIYRSSNKMAFGNGWIDAAQLEKLATPLAKNGYGQYLLTLLKRGIVR